VQENVLNETFVAQRPNQVYMADITYIPTDEGWLYLAGVEDLYSRKIAGWSAGARMTKERCIQALERACGRQRTTEPVLHHSDRGSQYASHDYPDKLREYEMVGSMSRKGNCFDNACMESFHSIIKRELVYLETFKTREQAIRRIFEYIEVGYSRERIHSSIGFRTPDEYERSYFQALRTKASGVTTEIVAEY
jgi:putative transposase